MATYDDWRRRRDCGDKTPYRQAEAQRIARERGPEWRSYRCAYCSNFHVGHASRGEANDWRGSAPLRDKPTVLKNPDKFKRVAAELRVWPGLPERIEQHIDTVLMWLEDARDLLTGLEYDEYGTPQTYPIQARLDKLLAQLKGGNR